MAEARGEMKAQEAETFAGPSRMAWFPAFSWAVHGLYAVVCLRYLWLLFHLAPTGMGLFLGAVYAAFFGWALRDRRTALFAFLGVQLIFSHLLSALAVLYLAWLTGKLLRRESLAPATTLGRILDLLLATILVSGVLAALERQGFSALRIWLFFRPNQSWDNLSPGIHPSSGLRLRAAAGGPGRTAGRHEPPAHVDHDLRGLLHGPDSGLASAARAPYAGLLLQPVLPGHVAGGPGLSGGLPGPGRAVVAAGGLGRGRAVEPVPAGAHVLAHPVGGRGRGGPWPRCGPPGDAG